MENFIHHYGLYTATKLWLQKSRRLARSGYKDEARDFLNFVNNLNIVEILTPLEFPAGLNVDVAHLSWEIKELIHEVHPLTVSDNTDDFASINRSLHLIAAGVATLVGRQSNAKNKIFQFPSMAPRGRNEKLRRNHKSRV